jgi:hypothetical protein
MAITKTTYLELNKPDYNAIADIEVLNDNSDIIDEMFDGTHLVESVNGVTPTDGAVTIDLGVTSVNGQTGAVTITERSVKQLIDIIYPVGSYYETTNANFNPNTAWAGTTWQRITDGRVLIAGGGDYTVGNNYGEKTHKITIAEMPAHNHSASAAENGAHNHSVSGNTGYAGSHKHDRGDMNITGNFNASQLYDSGTNIAAPYAHGAFEVGGSVSRLTVSSEGDFSQSGFKFNAANTWTGYTNTVADHRHGFSATTGLSVKHSHTITIGNSGSGTAMSLVQPSKAVARWLRTA